MDGRKKNIIIAVAAILAVLLISLTVFAWYYVLGDNAAAHLKSAPDFVKPIADAMSFLKGSTSAAKAK